MNCIKGDLLQLALEGKFDLIIHGCNCYCTMGAGIAKQIKDRFPLAWEADIATPKGERSKLGTYSMAIENTPNGRLSIVNAYTQFDYSGQGVLVDYDAVKTVFEQIKLDFTGKRMGYPKIGAGLAGGDWKRLSGIIDNSLEGEEHTLVEFVGS